MATSTIEVDGGVVDSIWRYPVKSMAGEELQTCQVTERGLLGDRAYALVDKESNRAATVRTWAASLLNYQVRFASEPQAGAPTPPVNITSPSGVTLSSDQADIDERLSAAFARTLTILTAAPVGLKVEFPQGTLGGVHEKATELSLAGGAPAGTFFDYGSVHLVASSTLEHLQSAYPQGRFDVRRFRPNLVVGVDGEPFIENSWAGRTATVGDQVVLRVSIPCPRCVNTTLPQADLPRDPGILRTIAQLNRVDLGDFGKLPCVGVYAEVVKAGVVRRDDVVRWS
jgi:MOSC domain-containing protein